MAIYTEQQMNAVESFFKFLVRELLLSSSWEEFVKEADTLSDNAEAQEAFREMAVEFQDDPEIMRRLNYLLGNQESF